MTATLLRHNARASQDNPLAVACLLSDAAAEAARLGLPLLVELFGGASGAGVGYARSGFYVVSNDVADMPNNPHPMIKADALWLLDTFGDWFQANAAAVHASPPCQGYSGMSNCRPGLAEKYPQLVDAVRALLDEIGRPWVIENVTGSGLAEQTDLFDTNGLLLCGAMFGRALYRHRLFEASFPLISPDHPAHLVPASKAGHWVPGTVISVAGNCSPIKLAKQVMGIDWMNRSELAESIPPYFTEYIGEQLMTHLVAAPVLVGHCGNEEHQEQP